MANGDRIMDLYIYIDESGVIPKPHVKVGSNNCFVLSVIITTQKDKLNRKFKAGMNNFIKKHPEYKDEFNKNKEIKGSNIKEKDKPIIFEKICNHCSDYTEIGIIQLHNNLADDKFREVPARAFNYLVWKFLIRYYFKHSRIITKPVDSVWFFIDERNVAPKAIHDLTGYLEMKNFELPQPLFKNVSVKYVDSSQNHLVQFSDMVANSYFRWLRFNKKGSVPISIQILDSMLVNSKIFEYPEINDKE